MEGLAVFRGGWPVIVGGGSYHRFALPSVESPLVSSRSLAGWVASIRRYPVKSMLGEELDAAPVTTGGLLGDRGFALVDVDTGKVASAKNPKKWGQLLQFQSSLPGTADSGEPAPRVRIVFPDGTTTGSERPDVDSRLSAALGARVRLVRPTVGVSRYEEYWPDVEGLERRDSLTDETLPPRSFFDAAPVHLLTTATLARLGELHPDGRFDPSRFRPNILVASVPHAEGFVESDWVDRTLHIGDGTRLGVRGPCGRCVMTTLPQGDLAPDLGILRTAAQHNRGKVGAYASVEHEGTIRVGDPVWVD